ncbi:MAG: RCC1 domain-containing protein [Polyangiales bacterium]
MAAALDARRGERRERDDLVDRRGYGHVCAIIDGRVRCWGKNSKGQLGTGDDANRAEPVAVSTLATPTAVCSGEAFSCAMGASGGVQALGAQRRRPVLRQHVRRLRGC